MQPDKYNATDKDNKLPGGRNTVRGPLNIICWVLVGFIFILHNLYHALILAKSLFTDSATTGLINGKGTNAKSVTSAYGKGIFSKPDHTSLVTRMSSRG